MNSKLLLLILTLAFLLRFLYLGQIPRGISPDEISQAYDAYSLLQTGKDSWGDPWPIFSFRSFLDHKAPLQTYLMIPSIALFGLTPFATRLPAAIIGVLAILALYLLVHQLFGNKKIALLSALFFAINPWHINFSRVAMEAGITAFFFPLGLFFYLKGLKNPKFFYLSTVSWALGIYDYHSLKIFLPPFLLLLIFFSWPQLKQLKTQVKLLPLALLLFLILPLYYVSFFGAAGARGVELLGSDLNLRQTTILSFQRFYSPLFQIHPLLSALFHNRYLLIIKQVVGYYLSYFNPIYWFVEGAYDSFFNSLPGHGLSYLWELPFIFFGLIHLAQQILKPTNKKWRFAAIMIVAWILLSPLPAIITKSGDYKPNRANLFLGVFPILTTLGLSFVYQILKPIYRRLLTLVLVPTVILFFASYINFAAFASFIEFPDHMTYGWQQAAQCLKEVEPKYGDIYIEKRHEPQSQVMFYFPLPPENVQSAALEWQKQIDEETRPILYLDMLDKYRIEYQPGRDIIIKTYHWPDDIDRDAVYLSYPSNTLPHDRVTHCVIKGPTQEPLFEVFSFHL